VMASRRTGTALLWAGSTTVTVPALEDDDALALAEWTADDDVDPARLDELARLSQGNPTFLVELSRFAGRRGGEGDLPGSLDALLATSLAAIGRLERYALRTAAVQGERVDLSLLRRVDGSHVADMLDELARTGRFVLRRGTEIGFVSGVHHRAVYDRIPFAVRRSAHAAYAAAIEERSGRSDGPDAAQLAAHWTAAGEPSRAWPWAVRAAHRARARSSHDEVVGVLEPLVLRSGSQRRDVAQTGALVMLGESLALIGRLSDGERAMRRALRLASSHERPAILRAMGVADQRAMHHTRALRRFRAARREMAASTIDRPDDATLFLALRIDEASGLAYADRYDEALAAVQPVIDEARSSNDRATLAAGLLVAETCLSLQGHDTAAITQEALGLLLPEDHNTRSTLLINAGLSALNRGAFDRAEPLLRSGEMASLLAGNRPVRSTCRINLASLFTDQGRIDEAVEALDSVRRMIRSFQAGSADNFIAFLRARHVSWSGEPELAAAHLHDISVEAARLDDSFFAACASVYRAEALVIAGRYDEALTEAAAAATSDEVTASPLVGLTLRRFTIAARQAHEPIDATIAELRKLRVDAAALGIDVEEAAALDALHRLGAATKKDQRRCATLMKRHGVVAYSPLWDRSNGDAAG
jgi:tetratricopeptide (TPR) repeat protein